MYSYEYAYIGIHVDIYNTLLYLLLDLQNNNNNKNREVVKTWLAGQSSCTLIIPKDFAKRYGSDSRRMWLWKDNLMGILIRKLEVY